MATETIKLDSSGARKDLAALAEALDRSNRAMKSMDAAFATAASGIDRSMSKAAKSVEKYAQVMALVSKMRVNGDPAAQIRQFATAMDSLGRVRTLPDSKLTQLKQFFALLPTFKAPGAGAAGPQLQRFFAGIANIRAPTAVQIKNLKDLFIVLKDFQGAPRSTGFKTLTDTLANLRVPTTQQIQRLMLMFQVLSTAKRIPNANAIATDLDHVAAAATRAGRALATLPPNLRNLGGTTTTRSINSLNNALNQTNTHLNRSGAATRGARAGFVSLGAGMDGLNARFKLSYQLGTAFTTLFSAFTLGAFVRSIYDTEVSFQKLNKAMLFITGTFKGAHDATADYIAISNDLGINFEKNADAFGRFAISAHAVGATFEDAKGIYAGASLALQAAGASAQQAEYAFYGLGQMLSKGKVMSEEFNRQVGEQIPGNVVAGARALSTLEGHLVTTADLFQQMKAGTIQSLPFLREWAKELDRMYAPLKGLIQARPDVAVNRLMNAFTLFKKEVAESGFMGAFVVEMNKGIGQLVDANGQLTQKAKDLAHSIGKGLADLVHLLGTGIQWVVTHIDLIVAGLKGLAALSIGATIAGWGKSFAAFGDELVGATAKLLTFKSVAGGGLSIPGFSTIGRGVSNIAGPGRASTMGVVGQRALNSLYGAPVPLTGAQRFGQVAGGVGQVVGGAAQTAFAGLRGALNTIPTVAMAAAVALAIFGDNIVQLGGKAVKVNDIAGAAMKNIGTSFLDWLNGAVGAISKMAGGTGKVNANAGEWIAAFAAGIITVVEVVGEAAVAIGKIIGTLISSVIKLSEAFALAQQGKFGEAGALVGSIGTDISNQTDSVVKGFGKAGNYQQHYNDIVKGAQDSAAGRDANAAADTQMTAAQRQAEAALAQLKAQDDAAKAAAAFHDAVYAFKELVRPISYEQDILPRIKALMDGSFQRSLGTSQMGTPPASAANYGSIAGRGNSVATPPAAVAQRGNITISSREQMQQVLDAQFGRGNAHITSGFRSASEQADLIRRYGPHYASTHSDHLRGTAAAPGAYDIQVDGVPASQVLSRLEAIIANPGQGLVEFARGQRAPHVHLAIRTAANGVTSGGRGAINHGGAGMTPQQIAAFTPTPSDAAGGGAGPLGNAPTDTEANTLAQARQTAWGKLQSVIREGNPADQAVATEQESLKKLLDVVEEEEGLARRVGKDFKTFIGPEAFAELNSAVKRMEQKVEDARNPIGKEMRLLSQSNDAQGLRVSGLSDEAEWLEKINALKEEGYDTSKMDLATLRQQWQVEKDRTDNLSAQLELTTAMNAATVARIGRSGTGRDQAFAAQISGHLKPGESYEQGLARMQGNGTALTFGDIANTQDQSRRDDVTKQINDAIAETRATARMSGSARQYRDDFKGYLKELTGSTSDSLDELMHLATDADKSLARYAANVKYAAEHPPGFQKWADGLAPISERLQDIKAQFAEDLSGSITDALMGDKVDWRGMLHNTARALTKAYVDEGLKGIINMATGHGAGQGAGVPGDATAGAGGPLGSLGAALGLGGAPGAAGAAAGSAYTLNAATVYLNAGSIMGGGAGGGLASILGGGAANDNGGTTISDLVDAASNRFTGSDTGSGSGDVIGDILGSVGGAWGSGSGASAGGGGSGIADLVAAASNRFTGGGAAAGGGAGGGGLLGGLGGMGGLGLGLAGVLLGQLTKPKAANDTPLPPINGIIGESRPISTTGTEVAAHGNVIGDLLSMGLNAFTGGFGAGGGMSLGKTFGNMGSAMSKNLGGIGKFFGFSEGGYTTNPVSMVGGAWNWNSAKHYAEGTHNTSGGMPAIVHPDEAVIPLSRGRSIPVDMKGASKPHVTVNSPIIVYAHDVDSFRQSKASISRKQNQTLKRAATRNLDAAA